MPPKHDKSQPRSKQNRSNTPVHVNAGLAAKQRGENAAGSWKFAKNMTIKDPSRTMQTVGRATNTYITYDNKFEFRFWGSLENVERAKIDLETNIKQDNPTFQHQKTAVGPSRDAQFEAMGSFLWPSEEYPAPNTRQHEIESLDPIRKENSCVIYYDGPLSSFIVKGSVEDVQEALLRIRGLLCKAVVQSSPIQRLYLVQNECQRFILTDHPLKVVYRAAAPITRRMEKTVKSVGARPRAEDVALNAKRMKDLVVQTLSKVHWHQGHIDMRVHLGTLILDNYQPFESNSKTLLDFKEMIQDSYNFRAKVTEELGNKILEDSLLQRFLSATNSLSPYDRFTHDLFDTKPEYTASIEVDVKDGGGHLLITKRWHEENGSFSASNPEFKRVVQDTGRTRFLEVYISDTLSDLTWLLDISALGVPQPSHLPDWAQNHGEYYVNLDPKKARDQESFCEFEKFDSSPRPLAHKRASREKIIWKFEMKAPYAGYEVELAKVFNKVYTPVEVGGREPETTFEERWTVDVKHRQWSSLLSENHELRAGIGAEWKADIQSWFPVESNDTNEKLKGHVELLHALQHVQDIVMGKDLRAEAGGRNTMAL